MAQNYYDLLGVTRDATAEEIKKAYKKAALLHHPDKGGDTEKFKECGAALETLTDERKRNAYDSALIRARSFDGLGGGNRFQGRDAAADRGRASSASARGSAPPPPPPPPGGGGAAASASRPPRPPPSGAVEIPSDPSNLSVRELKDLLTALGIDHEGALEKADLLNLLQNRKERRAGRDSTPRGSAAPPSSSSMPQPSPAEAQKATGASTPLKPSEMDGPRALRIKVLSLGSAAVGKSTLIKRYCESRFVQKYITTIGIDYGVKPVKVLGLDVKVNFFDTSGGEEFKEIRADFYDKTGGVLLCYDVTNRQSFMDLERWLEEAKRHRLSLPGKSGELPFVVVCANKVDLPRRVVTKPEGMEFASAHGFCYFETSANTGESVVEAMNCLFEKVVGNHLEVRRRLAAG